MAARAARSAARKSPATSYVPARLQRAGAFPVSMFTECSNASTAPATSCDFRRAIPRLAKASEKLRIDPGRLLKRGGSFDKVVRQRQFDAALISLQGLALWLMEQLVDRHDGTPGAPDGTGGKDASASSLGLPT